MTRDRQRSRPSSRRARPSNRKPPPRSGRREALVLAAIGAPILIVAVVAALVIGGPSNQPGSAPSPTAALAGASDATLVYADSPSLGPTNAQVTLVEFLDPECEACRAFYPVVKAILADYKESVRLVVRYVPGHGNSALAIAALEEAGRQDRYWETLELFFARQQEWGEQSEPQTQAFLAYGKEAGLDVTALESALTSPDFTKLKRDVADGQALRVNATPTFFVNGVRVDQLSEQGLRQAIELALNS